MTFSEQERRLFAKLSVFAGGCTFAAAEQIADADLETLQSLVEKSLLRFSTERYWMLETIREFATEALGSAELATLKPRHANHFLILLESAEADLSGGSVKTHSPASRPSATTFGPHSTTCGRPARRKPSCASRLPRPASGARATSRRDAGDSRMQLRVRRRRRPRYVPGHSTGSPVSRDSKESRTLPQNSLRRASSCIGRAGDDIGVARTSGLIANVVMTSGDLDRAKVLMEEAAEAFRRLGMKREVSIALDNLGYVAALRGDDLEAQNLYEQSLQLAIENDSDEEATAVRLNLGFGALRRGDFAEAEHWFGQSAEYAVETGNKVTMSYCFEGWGSISAAQAAPAPGDAPSRRCPGTS